MRVSTEGLERIKRHEGCKLEAYPDPGSGGEPWTIGVGHTKGVKKGDRITEAQALDLLREDILWVENCVNDKVLVKISQNQFDALASFVFNVGCFAFGNSTLLKKLNQGDYEGAAKEFPRWTKASGKVLPGLVKRRNEEREVFLA